MSILNATTPELASLAAKRSVNYVCETKDRLTIYIVNNNLVGRHMTSPDAAMPRRSGYVDLVASTLPLRSRW